MTIRISASSRPLSIASMIACKLEPFPEINTPKDTFRAISDRSRGEGHSSFSFLDFTDNEVFFAQSADGPCARVEAIPADDCNHAETVIKSAVHLGLRDSAAALNEVKDWLRRP